MNWAFLSGQIIIFTEAAVNLTATPQHLLAQINFGPEVKTLNEQRLMKIIYLPIQAAL